eukprot:GSChrysophyteH1.ASY1.ANO1.543.1 assembled CDS
MDYIGAVMRRQLTESGDDSSGGPPYWVDFLVIVFLICGMYYMLRWLFQIAYYWQRKAEIRMEEALALRAAIKDNFRNENGYSWDYVFVFKVTKYTGGEEESKLKTENSMRNIVLKLASAGLQTKLFYSAQHDEVYCKIRAPLSRLFKEAGAVKYKLQSDPINVSNLLSIGNSTPEDKKWGPIRIHTDGIQTEIPPYDYIYAEYNKSFNTDDKMLYQKYNAKSIFRGVDRIKLIQFIITNPVESGGCGLNIHALKEQGCILGFFPIHDEVDLSQVETKWFIFWQWPSNTPVDDVKNYFGEKIGFLTAFFAHYTSWLMWPAFFGFCTWINVASDNGNPNVILAPVYAFGMAIWATLFLESWKRRENRLAMQWGVYGEARVHQVRPEYINHPLVCTVESPIDGKQMLYFPKKEFVRRQFLSTSTSFLFITCVVALLTGVFVGKFVMDSNPETTAWAGTIASLVNAIVVIIMGMVYDTVVTALNDYENHRTVSEYEDALIQKTFIVQFINTFTSLFFIAFAQPFLSMDTGLHGAIRRCSGSCMTEIQGTLSVLFMSKLATTSVISLVVPYINMRRRQKEEFEDVENEEDISLLEREFLREEYDLSLGPFKDYSEYTLQFAYATMFISAYPLATCLAVVSNYIEMRVKTWFFCHLSRRPVPHSVNNIGTWFDILEIISYAAVLVSAGLVAFTSDIASDNTWLLRIWLFIIFTVCIIAVKYFVQLNYPRVDEEIDIQIKRTDYIVDKLFYNTPDEDLTKVAADISSLAKAKLDIRVNDDDPC